MTLVTGRGTLIPSTTCVPRPKQKACNASHFLLVGEKASTAALEKIAALNRQFPVAGIISLQDFVIGGGEGRQASLRHIVEIGVPVLKAIRVTDRTEAEWRYSDDGLPWDSVHYRIAMPELQGIGQPLVVACSLS